MTTPKFEGNALPTLDRVKAIFAQRGGQYGDTWRNCQFVTLKSVARELGIEIPDDCCRALATAAFVDMKYQRGEGAYRDDNLIDGIAYSAFLAEEMRQLSVKRSPQQ